MGLSKDLCILLTIFVVLCLAYSQDYPTYSELEFPQTRFSCKNKVHGGYYADIETDCQMYHVCHRSKDGKMKDTKFLCGNGTVFDQRHLVCQDYRKVQRCDESRKYYNNVATLLERLEARLRNEETEKEIMKAADFEFGDPPTYSEMDMPETGFTCQDKVHGGYYADIETYCQMYHVCHRSEDRIMKDTKFLCANDTVFDQRHLICQDYRKVPYCGESEKYYRIVRTLLKRLEG
ncbi:chitin-binding type-2 domain-containing protein [Caerostris extrusa]|uniref:Chitin-binding type-2 domain-containing protein n=1 Tax=Caerostris extrusa TaxID=172846 RepID=A0AAV4XTS5_CAEEX|nr:chitin-binding type-2 domain-containing protein [Caerostris extrusa]